MRVSKFNIVSLIFGYAFLYLPILFLFVFSFNETRHPGIWKGFSLKWYVELFEDPYLITSILNSFKVAIVSATLATSLGAIASILHIRFKPFSTRQAMSNFLLIPLATPEVIIAFSLLLAIGFFHFLVKFPKKLGLTTIVIAHTTLAISYVYLVVHTRLREFDMYLEEAALDLGGTPIQVFGKITLPIIFPTIISGWLLAFALSLDDIVLASFLSGPGSTTLPILILSQIRMGISPSINALASLIILALSLVMLVISFLQQRR